MPISIECRLCGAKSPRRGFKGRMAWLRRHRRAKHYRAFRASIRKGVMVRRRRR